MTRFSRLVSAVTLVALLPVAVVFPVVVVIIGVTYGLVVAGRWFGHALREADERWSQLAPAYVESQRRLR